MKKCSKCKIEKSFESFSKWAKSKDGLQTTCKTCQSNYFLNNKERIYANKNKIRKEYYWEQKERHDRKKSRIKNRERYLFLAAKNRAKKYNIEFTIDILDILIPEFCPLLKERLSTEMHTGNSFSPSLDRIDSTKGYVPGNVWVISNKANRMKSNAAAEELIIFAKSVLDYWDK